MYVKTSVRKTRNGEVRYLRTGEERLPLVVVQQELSFTTAGGSKSGKPWARLIAADTPANRKNYEDLVLRTFYLSNGDITVVDAQVPTTTDQCKGDGWKEFGFANQGLCLAFVERGP